MKKCVIWLSILLLLCLPAGALTRESTIMLEGMEQPVTETLYESGLGCSFWYDASLLTVEESMSEDGKSLIVFPTESDGAIYLEIMLPEALDESFWAQAGDISDYQADTTDSGLNVSWLWKKASFNESFLEGIYIMTSPDDMGRCLIATTVYPMEVGEGFGKYFQKLLWSLNFDDGMPVTVEWLPVSLNSTTAENMVVMTAHSPVTDFRLLALTLEDIDEGGNPLFSTETVYARDELLPEETVWRKLTFFGDIPNNGISYIDENGVERRYAIDISGEDGSLVLWPF